MNPVTHQEVLEEQKVSTQGLDNEIGATQSPGWLIWEQRSFLALFAVRLTLIAALVLAVWPNRYEAVTSIMPPDTQSSPLAAMAMFTKMLPTSFGGDLFGLKNQGAVYVSILHSQNLQDRLINRFDLRKVYWVSLMKDARKKLDKYTTVDEDRKSGVITIKVTDRNRARARDLAVAYVEELNRISAELNTTAAHRERVFLEGRLQQVKDDLDKTSREFSDFASKNLAINIPEQGKAMVGAAATLQGELIAAESELRGLEQIYTEENVRTRVLKKRVAELRRQLEKMAGPAPGDSGDTQIDKDIYPSIRQLPVLGIRYLDLYRQLKIQETVFELLTQQFELAKVQEAKEYPTVRVLDAPTIPEKRASPQRGIILGACLILSLALGSSWILFKQHWYEMDSSSIVKTIANTTGENLRVFWQSEKKGRLIVRATRNGLRHILGRTKRPSISSL